MCVIKQVVKCHVIKRSLFDEQGYSETLQSLLHSLAQLHASHLFNNAYIPVN